MENGTITGYTDEGMPILHMTEEYRMMLERIPSRPYRGPSYTAEDIDEMCNAAENGKQAYDTTLSQDNVTGMVQ